ncbi:MAG: adenylyltransferase/cytidyltransferase family protein [Promethearchaeota archaeon]
MEKSIVYAYVVADLLHIGHLTHLENAKALGDKLIVGVLTDEAVMEKKKKPILHFEERFRLVKSLKCVDCIVIQTTYSPIHNIKTLKPNILMESDSHNEQDIENAKRAMEPWGGRVIVTPYYPEQSSTKIKKEIKNAG